MGAVIPIGPMIVLMVHVIWRHVLRMVSIVGAACGRRGVMRMGFGRMALTMQLTQEGGGS